MTLSLLLSCFYFGLALHYIYALDATAEGDFLHCDGDQAFNIIKKLITIYSIPTYFDFSLVCIFNRLDTLETHTASLNTSLGKERNYFLTLFLEKIMSLMLHLLILLDSQFSAPSSNVLKKALLGDNPMFSFQYFLFYLSLGSY
jgi:hypothetical protein